MLPTSRYLLVSGRCVSAQRTAAVPHQRGARIGTRTRNFYITAVQFVQSSPTGGTYATGQTRRRMKGSKMPL